MFSVGKPTPGTNSYIADEHFQELKKPHSIGEIIIHGPQVVSGYFNKPSESSLKKSGDNYVLKTGDVGFIDENGYFYVIDRIKDMIIVSGFKVWPREVEEVLFEHKNVKENAVIGV